MTYVTRNEEHLIYIGRHPYYEIKNEYGPGRERKSTKYHMFCDLSGENFRPARSVPSLISAVADEHCHPEFSNLVDKYLASADSAEIVEWIREPLDPAVWDRDWNNHHTSWLDAFMEYRGCPNPTRVHILQCSYGYRRGTDKTEKAELYYNPRGTVQKDGSSEYQNYDHRQHRDGLITDRSIFFDLYAVYSNGLKLKWS